jgi:alpha-tubulin suppressor-like RCC1 family protein
VHICIFFFFYRFDGASVSVVACGMNHTACITAGGRCWTWGDGAAGVPVKNKKIKNKKMNKNMHLERQEQGLDVSLLAVAPSRVSNGIVIGTRSLVTMT